MPFLIRPFRRFPICCSVTYNTGPFQGQGTVWNLSYSGWRFSGDLPLRPGEVCSLSMSLPNQETIFADAAEVRWVRANGYGTEIRQLDKLSKSRLENYVKRLVNERAEAIP